MEEPVGRKEGCGGSYENVFLVTKVKKEFSDRGTEAISMLQKDSWKWNAA